MGFWIRGVLVAADRYSFGRLKKQAFFRLDLQ